MRFCAVASVSPAAGPITTQSSGSASLARASGVSKSDTITASTAAAITGPASGGHRIRTSPAPIRSPARAASRAAPVCSVPPDTTPSRPR